MLSFKKIILGLREIRARPFSKKFSVSESLKGFRGDVCLGSGTGIKPTLKVPAVGIVAHPI